MLTLSRTVQASRSCGAENVILASEPNSGPGDPSGERYEFVDRIAYHRDRLSSTED